MDVVGRGESDWLEHKEDYGFPLYLTDAATLIALVSHTVRVGPVAQFIQRFRGKNQAPFIDWVGTSMGGLIGMMLASKPNSPIRRLVLNDVGPFVSWQALARLKNMHVGKAARFSDLDEAERHLRAACADFGPLSEEQWKHVTCHSVQSVEEGGYELAWDSAIARTLVVGDRRGIEFGSDFSYGVDLWPVWNAVRCPTLVLRGGKSAVLSATTARRMRRCIPKARVVEISGVGHPPWLMIEDQISLVRDFLLAPTSET
jgi:pimeloyl-ACP methyl ester carboxylesterase